MRPALAAARLIVLFLSVSAAGGAELATPSRRRLRRPLVVTIVALLLTALVEPIPVTRKADANHAAQHNNNKHDNEDREKIAVSFAAPVEAIHGVGGSAVGVAVKADDGARV